MGHIIEELISKLNRQECTEEEIDFLLNYFNFQDREELESRIEERWRITEFSNVSMNRKEDIWDYIRSATSEEGKPDYDHERAEIPLIRKKGRKRGSSGYLFKFAAVFIGLAVISIFALKNRFMQPATPNAITVEFGNGELENLGDEKAEALAESGVILEQDKLIYPASDTASGELKYHTIRIPHGRRFQVVLSDGTKVFLNSGSTFKYPVKFLRHQHREVFLEGEAFFTVTKSTTQKFFVQAGALETEVLGTEFNISYHKEAAETDIVLLEGSVRVNGEQSIVLEPDEKLSVLKKTGAFKIEEVESSDYIEWINGVIWFEDERFKDIIPKLERHFGVEISNDFKVLEEKRFTGRFETENLKEILETFNVVVDFEFQIVGKEVHINKSESL